MEGTSPARKNAVSSRKGIGGVAGESGESSFMVLMSGVGPAFTFHERAGNSREDNHGLTREDDHAQHATLGGIIVRNTHRRHGKEGRIGQRQSGDGILPSEQDLNRRRPDETRGKKTSPIRVVIGEDVLDNSAEECSSVHAIITQHCRLHRDQV